MDLSPTIKNTEVRQIFLSVFLTPCLGDVAILFEFRKNSHTKRMVIELRHKVEIKKISSLSVFFLFLRILHRKEDASE